MVSSSELCVIRLLFGLCCYLMILHPLDEVRMSFNASFVFQAFRYVPIKYVHKCTNNLSGTYEKGNTIDQSTTRQILILVAEIILALAIYLPSGVLELSQQPFRRGFFCHDESLMHPYRKDTISTALAAVLSFLIPLAVIITIEVVIANHDSCGVAMHPSPPVCGRRCPGTVVAVFRYMLWLTFTIGVNMLLTDVMKYSIGRLRPHFFAVCGFDPARVNCTSGYIETFRCTGDPKRIKEARLSFPSGHSSIAACSMFFCALYVHYRLQLPHVLVVKPFLKTVLLSLAVACACSRVSDYMHHWSDALTGFVLGAAVATTIVLMYTDLPQCRKQMLIDAEMKANGNSNVGMSELGTVTTVNMS